MKSPSKSLSVYDSLIIRACKSNLDYNEMLRRLKKIWCMRIGYKTCDANATQGLIRHMAELMVSHSRNVGVDDICSILDDAENREDLHISMRPLRKIHNFRDRAILGIARRLRYYAPEVWVHYQTPAYFRNSKSEETA